MVYEKPNTRTIYSIYTGIIGSDKLYLRKIPALSELFRPAKTDFSAVNMPTGTFPSDKISFNSSETSSARDEVLRKSSKLFFWSQLVFLLSM